jgi:hypothetical protein
MKLTFLGSESKDGQSPTLYATDRGTLVVQGWKITDETVRAQLRHLPDHEDVIEIPTALTKHFPTEV